MSNIKEITEERTITINLTISELARLQILLEDDIRSHKKDLDESLLLHPTRSELIKALKTHIELIKENIEFDESILNNISNFNK